MTRPNRVPDQVVAPYLEVIIGAVWWVIGTLALPSGIGTVLMAAGLGVTGVLWTTARRRFGAGVRLDPERRTRLLRLVLGALGLIVLAVVGLGATSWAELRAPVACAIVAAVLFPLASLLQERSYVAVGGLLLVLGASGALLALDAAGSAGPQGLVGMGAAAALWGAGALRFGLLEDVRDRVRR
ncbi:hypothetical protein ACFQE5_13805 [Pseudonocardia hispaniensis]|uniref:Uncharacterized protein n=1 Tax=Pseudonocardia hispaniensis TaxID=904933 RepID=A0ABW1J387_9PSEU